MDKTKGEGGSRGGRWVWVGSGEGWGENADNCNCTTAKYLKKTKTKLSSSLFIFIQWCNLPWYWFVTDMEMYHLYLLKEGLFACVDGSFLSRNPTVASHSGTASVAESSSCKIMPFLSQHPLVERVTKAWPCHPNEGDLWWILGVPELPVGSVKAAAG